MADTETLLRTTVPAFLDPVPSKRSLDKWLHGAGINHLKANPDAKRGGGRIYWHVAQVEKFLRQRAGLVGSGQEAA